MCNLYLTMIASSLQGVRVYGKRHPSMDPGMPLPTDFELQVLGYIYLLGHGLL